MSYCQGKHAVVTGGGSGIGEAVAQALISAGCTVTIMGRNAKRLQAVADAIGAEPQVADVTDRGSIRQAFAGAVETSGPVTILVNNAGIAEAVPFTKMTDDVWDRLIAVNLTGVFNCTHAVAESMLASTDGRIINMASVAALDGYAYISAYCATKHALLGLTRSLAKEFATAGVTVNAVCPGYVRTDIVDNAINNIMEKTGRSKEEALAELVSVNPQGRLIEPEEVANTVIWLCEQQSVNGQAIAISGGQ